MCSPARRESTQLYEWIKARRTQPGERKVQLWQADEFRRPKSELKRVPEARDILKMAAAYLAKQPG